MSLTDQQPTVLLLTGAHVLDPDGERWIERVDVLVQDGRITRIAPPAALPPPPDGSRRIDLSGRWLAPGLIDLHTHILLQPYSRISWEDQVLRESLERRTIHGLIAARASLLAGFTTLRDLGTEGAGLADVALRDTAEEKVYSGPRLFVATYAIVATGCYMPSRVDPRWSGPGGAQAADGPSGARRAVREQIAAGADWIKVYADFRRRRGAPVTPTFSQQELDAIVDEARSACVPVAAHATTDEGILRAVRAGVATIEHAHEATDVSLVPMRDAGVALCPTLAAVETFARMNGWKPTEPEPAPLRRAKDVVARAVELGVTIGCGSDAGVFAHGDNAREIELMAQCGMTPAQALRAATRTAAQILGRAPRPSETSRAPQTTASRGERSLPGASPESPISRSVPPSLESLPIGVIAEGCAADLVAFASDPLINPGALRVPILVVKDGRFAREV